MEPFLGTYKLEKSENFDEYLAAKGVPWLIRKLILASKVTKTIEKVDENTYVATDSGSKSTTTWRFKLGETFEGKGFDGKMHRITFEIKDGQLYETHIRFEDPQYKDQPEVFRYELQGDDTLITHLQHEQIHAKRFFKRQK